MTSSNVKKVMFLATIAAFAILLCAAPRAYAQNDGPCCAQTAHTIVNCKMTGCSGSITYTSCAEPQGPSSVHYRVTEVKCCSETYTSFTAPTGGNGCSDNAIVNPIVASTPSTALNTTLYAEGVWVRTCKGKYVFTVRPS